MTEQELKSNYRALIAEHLLLQMELLKRDLKEEKVIFLVQVGNYIEELKTEYDELEKKHKGSVALVQRKKIIFNLTSLHNMYSTYYFEAEYHYIKNKTLQKQNYDMGLELAELRERNRILIEEKEFSIEL